MASMRNNKLPSGLYKNNGKPTIDSIFFKSMTKTIKANRASIADAEVVDEAESTTDVILLALYPQARRPSCWTSFFLGVHPWPYDDVDADHL